jgi:large subunit ribosomal protein L23
MATEVQDKTKAATVEHSLLAPHQIIVRPLVTEKGMHRSTRQNAYAFEVNKLANKGDIRRAVEELFNVKVQKVYIQNRKGKPRRSRFRTVMTGDWKKAIVKLHADHRIDFY